MALTKVISKMAIIMGRVLTQRLMEPGFTRVVMRMAIGTALVQNIGPKRNVNLMVPF